MVWLFLFCGSLFLIGALVPPIGDFVLPLFGSGAVGSLFFIWMVAMSLSQAVFNRELSLRWRAVILVVAALTLLAPLLVNSRWRSGWVPSIVVVAVILWFRSPKLSLVLFLIAAIVYRDLPSQLISDDLYSYNTRLAAWEVVMKEMVRANPILGFGPANYHYYTPLFSILGYNINFNSHNNYVDIVAQTGFLGLGLFVWFLVEIGLLGLRLRREVTDGFRYAYVIGALAGLAATAAAGMLGDWVIPFVYNIGLRGFRASVFAFLFLGGLVAIDQVKKLSNPEP
jgi:O-antigen ligase